MSQIQTTWAQHPGPATAWFVVWALAGHLTSLHHSLLTYKMGILTPVSQNILFLKRLIEIIYAMLTLSLLFNQFNYAYNKSAVKSHPCLTLQILLCSLILLQLHSRVYRSSEHQAYFPFQVLALAGFSIWNLFPQMFPWLTPSLYPGFCSDVISLRGFPDFYPLIFFSP